MATPSLICVTRSNEFTQESLPYALRAVEIDDQLELDPSFLFGLLDLADAARQ